MTYEIKELSQLNEGMLLEVEAGNKKLVVARVDGDVYAISAKCTHLGCSLAKGELRDLVITCPCHGSEFSIVDGTVVSWVGEWPKILSNITKILGLSKDLKTYQILEKDGKYYIDI